MRITVINGPNLNLLGTREPEVYGSESLVDLEATWRDHADALDIDLGTFQSNHEGAIIDAIHAAGRDSDGIVINPGAYAHYSYAIHDALASIDIPAVEVHISDIKRREPWRATSVVASAAESVIYGRGTIGYINAIDHLWALHTIPPMPTRYGDHPDQVVDVREIPDAKGTVLLIHGGFWRAKWTRDLMDPLAIALCEDGWSTLNLEYRRGDGGLPASREDLRDAISALASNGRSPIVAVGHSAGGYLAIDAGHVEGISGVVALAPVVDLDALRANHPSGRQLAAAAGTSDDEWSLAPLAVPSVPTSILHGTADDDIPIGQSEAFAHSSHATFIGLDGIGHIDIVDPASPAFAVLLSELARVAR